MIITTKHLKSYRPQRNSISSGQVLQSAYTADKAKLIVKEMTDLLVLDLVDKKLVTDQIIITMGYDIENLNDPEIRKNYHGEITTDHYGRHVPKHAHGTINLPHHQSSEREHMSLHDRAAQFSPFEWHKDDHTKKRGC